MSIPKEPRQLMINIMYLVLTALLALNVSAEIFNAFKVVDQGLKSSNKALDDSNAKLPDIIKERAKKTKELEKYAERVDPARQLSREFTTYIDGIVDHMIDQSGDANGVHDDGDYRDVKGVKELKGKKDKDITTRYLVEDDKKGAELKEKVMEYRTKFLELIDDEDKAAFEREIAMGIDDETWRNSANTKKNTNWETFNFRQMPLAATMPIFSKFKNDAKATEAAILNYLQGKVGGEEIVLDQFTVVSAPKKSYVIKGETFETDVFLSASASANSNTGISMRINGSPATIDENGVAKWRAPASSVGIKRYNAEITTTNPTTGEVKTYTNSFEYEVGERSVTVSPTKMNVFYIGVENPVEISAAGISSNDMKVSMSGAGGGTISRKDGGFVVNVNKQTRKGEFAKINVSAPGISVSKDFRVKRIPDPIVTLSGKQPTSMGNGEFKAQGALIPVLQGFDFDARCNIVGFNFYRSAKRQDPETSVNKGGSFTANTKNIQMKAKPGDIFLFEGIKCRCPGDVANRPLPNMVVRIK
ncbi:MAG: gliding motility protein GldM [Saprospiraceae bacterium]|nr:gliding motility protein GldM [Saprospiraceae bacterium]